MASLASLLLLLGCLSDLGLAIQALFELGQKYGYGLLIVNWLPASRGVGPKPWSTSFAANSGDHAM
jgi:hypothetical protein